MKSFNPNLINEVLARADIVDVISSYIPVIKKGSSYVAMCPFHNDTNPSLNISPSKKIFKCFACNQGGNAISFVEKYENISFFNALKKVAARVGYDDPSLHAVENKTISINEPLYKALKDAQEFFHLTINTLAGKKAQDYFSSRKIDEKMQAFFKLGYAPSDSILLIKNLRSKGHDIVTLDKAGLTIRDKSEIVDRFRGRVIFPLHDENGRVIGFSGRRIEGDSVKYLNSPASEIFDKSAVMYNYDNALHEARNMKCVYVTEGFMDVFALYKIGFTCSVAIMGTAFTPKHAKMLRKLNVPIYLMLDGDDAGQNEMLKMIPLLEAEKLDFKLVDYDSLTQDPDEILNQLGEEKLKEVAQKLISPNEFLIKYYLKNHNINETEGKKDFLRALAPRVYTFQTEFDKEAYANRISSLVGVSLSTFKEFAQSGRKIEKRDYIPDEIYIEPLPKKKINKIQFAERELLYQMLNNKEAINDFLQEGVNRFDDDIYGLIYNYLLDLYDKKVDISPSSLIGVLNSSSNVKPELIQEVTSLMMEESHPPYDQELILEYSKSLKSALERKEKKQFRKNKLSGLTDEEKIEILKNIDERK